MFVSKVVIVTQSASQLTSERVMGSDLTAYFDGGFEVVGSGPTAWAVDAMYVSCSVQ